jgi:hypothetical protein
MAGLSATLTEFADNGNSRTYIVAGHTATAPRLVLQKRTVPSGNQIMTEFGVTVLRGVEDPEGAIMPQKASMGALVRYPVIGSAPTPLAADLAEMLTLFRDVVASDEFGASITSLGWVE